MEDFGLDSDDDKEQKVKLITKIKYNFAQIIAKRWLRRITSITVPIVLFFIIWVILSEVASDLDFINYIFAVLSLPVLVGPYFLMEKWYKKIRRENIVIDEKTGTAILLKRSVFSSSYLHRSIIREIEHKNHDAKWVYNGMTIGGVTSGEIHYEKAYTSATLGASSFRARVWAYDENDKYADISKIKLTPTLLKEAKQHRKISLFIKDDYIDLRLHNESTHLTKTELSVLESAICNNDDATLHKTIERAYIEQFLHKNDVKYIIGWIHGDIIF